MTDISISASRKKLTRAGRQITAARGDADATFAQIVTAARAGDRCPLNAPLGPLRPHAVAALADAGRIRVEVSGKNWRRVVILDGEHAGKATAPDPGGFRAASDNRERENDMTKPDVVARLLHGERAYILPKITRCPFKTPVCVGEFSESGRRGVDRGLDPTCRLPPKFMVGDRPYCRRHAGLVLLDLATAHLPPE